MYNHNSFLVFRHYGRDQSYGLQVLKLKFVPCRVYNVYPLYTFLVALQVNLTNRALLYFLMQDLANLFIIANENHFP